MKKANRLNMDDAINDGIAAFGILWQGKSKITSTPSKIITKVNTPKRRFSIYSFMKIVSFFK
jgi:hypothetical protein